MGPHAMRMLGIGLTALVGWASSALGQEATPSVAVSLGDQRARFAATLIASADQAYARQRYARARRDYGDSVANAPSAYAYVMYGDARWREVIQAAALPAKHCAWSHADLARTLTMELPQTYEAGLALAEQARTPHKPSQARLFKRAQYTASCLASLADHYKTLPPADCPDLKPLKACLGKPLR